MAAPIGKLKFKTRGEGRRNVVTIVGTILVGAAGAVTVGAGTASELATVVKNAAAGRYDLTFDHVYRGTPRLVGATLTRPNTTSFGNVAANAVQGQAGATNGTFTLQAILTSTGVDTDVLSGQTITYEIEVMEG